MYLFFPQKQKSLGCFSFHDFSYFNLIEILCSFHICIKNWFWDNEVNITIKGLFPNYTCFWQTYPCRIYSCNGKNKFVRMICLNAIRKCTGYLPFSVHNALSCWPSPLRFYVILFALSYKGRIDSSIKAVFDYMRVVLRILGNFTYLIVFLRVQIPINFLIK